MLNKIYENIKIFIKQNYIFIVVFIVSFIFFNIRLPYNIKSPGSLINLEDKISINSNLTGSYNMTYVNEYKANMLGIIISLLNNNWDLEKNELKIMGNLKEQDLNKRGKLLLEEVNRISIINAYRMANKKIEIENKRLYVNYIDTNALTNLKIGDELISVDNIKINNMNDIAEILNTKNYNDEIQIQTDNGIKNAKVMDYYGSKKLGISISTIYDLDSSIEFMFEKNESGSSGGLMMSLYIYNSLINEDLTKGKTVSGTGTIDIDGNIGEISGVKYKLIGAYKNKADIFFVPKNNYLEALEVKEEKNMNINIVSVSTLEEAISYLKNN